jgi:phage head-tail adaptor, putative, SPP1 family
MAISPYSFNRRVQFGTAKSVTNKKTGGTVPTFIPQFKRYCAIRTRTLNQQYLAIQNDMKDSIVVAIRHTPKVNESLLAKLGDKVYQIIDISPDESNNMTTFDLITMTVDEKVGG